MLSLIVLFLVVLFSCGHCVPSNIDTLNDCRQTGLQEDLKEFVNIIPIEDVRNLTKFYYGSDSAMRNS